jgi:hypothetical protein
VGLADKVRVGADTEETLLPAIVTLVLDVAPRTAPAVGLDSVTVKVLLPVKGVALLIGTLIVFDFVVAEKESVPCVAV